MVKFLALSGVLLEGVYKSSIKYLWNTYSGESNSNTLCTLCQQEREFSGKILRLLFFLPFIKIVAIQDFWAEGPLQANLVSYLLQCNERAAALSRLKNIPQLPWGVYQ